MTSVLRIFFSAALLANVAAASTVRGSIDLLESRDPMVRRHKDFSGVVV